MAGQTQPKTGFEKWKDGIDKAKDNPKWNAWDCEIQKAVNEYNDHLSNTPGYVRLDWQAIKAVLWVESGPHKADWNFKPMQIGIIDDPGMDSFLFGKEGGDLILPSTWKGRLKPETVRTMPAHNIRAGIGYLLMRMAYYEYRSVLDSDTKVYEITVKPGDTFDRIAKRQGSTSGIMTALNPTVDPRRLRPGQVVKYQKASLQRVITGWRRVSAGLMADRYNGGGDLKYAKRFDYALSAVRKGGAAICAN